MQSIRVRLCFFNIAPWEESDGRARSSEYATASGNDYAAHEQQYHTFVTITKFFVAVIAAIVILMAIFLT
jgi:hypothetical protein